MNAQSDDANRPKLPPRRNPVVAAVARRWRELTSGRLHTGRLGPGEPTLLACSGGADSSAMVLALAAVTRKLTIAHVVHDLRPEEESLADRDTVRRLAELLDLPYVESHISTRLVRIDGSPPPARLVRRAGDRNAEGLARRLRYLALATLAHRHSLRFIATAHHAGDQLESILMALARGAGPHGLRGVASSRPAPSLTVPPTALDTDVRIIRPMLAIPREACLQLCRDAGWAWRDDATNADTSRLRAHIRHNVVPVLRAGRPDIEHKAAATAELLADAAALVRDRAAHLLTLAESPPDPPGTLRWSREALRRERAAVLGDLFRLAAHTRGSPVQMDRLARAHLDAPVAAVRSRATHPRRFRLHAFDITVAARHVLISPRPPANVPASPAG